MTTVNFPKNGAGDHATNLQTMFSQPQVKHPIHMPLALSKGFLYGLSGNEHTSRMKEFDLSVFLNAGHIPTGAPYTSGMKAPFLKDVQRVIALPITDGDAFKWHEGFDWTVGVIGGFLDRGADVAVSCFGGHGRTGMLLAIIYGLFHPEDKTPIETIRRLVCKKSVETWAQVDFICDYLKLPRLVKPAYQEYWKMYESEIEHQEWIASANEREEKRKIIAALPTSGGVGVEPLEGQMFTDRFGSFVVINDMFIPVVKKGELVYALHTCPKDGGALAELLDEVFFCIICNDSVKVVQGRDNPANHTNNQKGDLFAQQDVI